MMNCSEPLARFAEKVEYVGVRYGGEYGDDPLYEYTVDGETVEVGYNSIEKFWYVIWGGGLDYEGNKRDLLKRYPFFKGFLEIKEGCSCVQELAEQVPQIDLSAKPAFQRRHYVDVANLLATIDNSGLRQQMADKFAAMFEADNPSFNRERFMKAVNSVFGGSGEYSEFAEIDLTDGGKWVSDKHKTLFRQAMEDHLSCFKGSGMTCNVGPGQIIDDIKEGCEVAYIGSDFTWHTHPCGVRPSDADIKTNIGLKKRFLMIGLSPEKLTYVYDLGEGMLADGGSPKLVGKFK